MIKTETVTQCFENAIFIDARALKPLNDEEITALKESCISSKSKSKKGKGDSKQEAAGTVDDSDDDDGIGPSADDDDDGDDEYESRFADDDEDEDVIFDEAEYITRGTRSRPLDDALVAQQLQAQEERELLEREENMDDL